jgi:hypothetical protein
LRNGGAPELGAALEITIIQFEKKTEDMTVL